MHLFTVDTASKGLLASFLFHFKLLWLQIVRTSDTMRSPVKGTSPSAAVCVCLLVTRQQDGFTQKNLQQYSVQESEELVSDSSV